MHYGQEDEPNDTEADGYKSIVDGVGVERSVFGVEGEGSSLGFYLGETTLVFGEGWEGGLVG